MLWNQRQSCHKGRIRCYLWLFSRTEYCVIRVVSFVFPIYPNMFSVFGIYSSVDPAGAYHEVLWFLGVLITPSKWVQMQWSGERASLTLTHANKEDEGLYTLRVAMGEYYEEYSGYVFVRGRTLSCAQNSLHSWGKHLGKITYLRCFPPCPFSSPITTE